MDFELKILFLSFFITIVLAFIIIPTLRRVKAGQIEREDGPQSHLKKQGTPTMGGIIMQLGLVLTCIFICFYMAHIGKGEMVKTIVPLLFISFGFGLIGLIDDFMKLILKNTKGLKPAYKMIGLLVISILYVLYITQILKIGTDICIPFVKTYITLPIWLYIPFAIFVLLATTNAINLTDGVDGLATSITTIIVTCLTVIAILFGVTEVSIFGSVLIGACLGFLMFNLHPAKIFMGDTGSLMLGGVIASMALYLKMPLLLLVVAFIPVLETLSVIIQVAYFKKTGNRIFKMAPLHHHFELSGWNENKVVSIFSIITLVLCIIGLKII